MPSPSKVKRYTPQEYYALERVASHKSDYFDGQIFEIWRGDERQDMIAHSLIASNLVRELGNRLKGTSFSAYESTLELKVKATGFRCNPDVAVYRGQPECDSKDPSPRPATNPTALFEVLSVATEGYDRGFKAHNYRQIESLHAYIFVSQFAPHIEVYRREEDGDWRLLETKGLDASVEIPGIGVTLPMAEIYEKVRFGEGQLSEEDDQVPE